MKTPILVVTSENWSREGYVVFDDDQIIGGCIPSEWVNQAVEDSDDDDTRADIEVKMTDDFFRENSKIDRFWSDRHILRTGGDYYSYDDDGMCKYLRNITDEEIAELEAQS